MQKRTLLIMFMSTSLAFGHYQHLKPSYKGPSPLFILAGIIIPLTAFYVHSDQNIKNTNYTFRDEEGYNNQFFAFLHKFNPEDRLICKWGLDVSNEEMLSFIREHKEKFDLALQSAARGGYIIKYKKDPYFLRSFYRDLKSELKMIAQQRCSLIPAKTLAFGLRGKAKEGIDILSFYEERLEIIKQVILEMPEYQQQVQKYVEQKLIKYAWNT